jgi:uncharacterized protein with PIN domain
VGQADCTRRLSRAAPDAILKAMVTATFQFYDELNDFLPAARRQRAFAVPCARAATAKHMIEALGVPHTEVGRLHINEADAGLDQMLQEGDRVGVFPGSLPPPSPALFVADAHLGGLARLLRMAGFDTLYDNAFDDAEIAAISARQQRIVLTRDRDLLIRKEIMHGCYVRALKAEPQAQQVLARYRLAQQARPFTLCLHCNARLHAVAKSEVEAGLPPQVRALQQTFRRCAVCNRVYWKGSHWQRMDSLLRRIFDQAG